MELNNSWYKAKAKPCPTRSSSVSVLVLVHLFSLLAKQVINSPSCRATTTGTREPKGKASTCSQPLLAVNSPYHPNIFMTELLVRSIHCLTSPSHREQDAGGWGSTSGSSIPSEAQTPQPHHPPHWVHNLPTP